MRQYSVRMRSKHDEMFRHNPVITVTVTVSVKGAQLRDEYELSDIADEVAEGLLERIETRRTEG